MHWITRIRLLKHFLKLFSPRFILEGHQYPPRQLFLATSIYTSIQEFPLISIVIPSYNQGDFLGHAIQSVIKQGYPNLELIVVDGGSKDHSVDIIKKYEASISWWCGEKDEGQANGINKGFQHASGEIMAWLNADDLLAPGCLLRVADNFFRNKNLDVVYGQRILIDEQGRDIGRWILPKHVDRVLYWVDFVPQETMFWRRGVWQKVGGSLDESFDFALDWDLILRFLQQNATIVRLPYFLGMFRMHKQQKSQKNIDQIGFAEMDRLRKRYLGYIPSSFEIAFHVAGYLFKARLIELAWKFGMIQYD